MTYVAVGERERFLVEVNEEIDRAQCDGDPDLAAALMLDAVLATLGDVEPTETFCDLGLRLAQMDEVRLRRVAAIIDERHEQRSPRPETGRE